MKKNISALLLSASVGFVGFANAGTQKIDPASIKYEEYNYSMHLDIKKVISMSNLGDSCTVVPATMVYENSKGEIKGLKYEAMGNGCMVD